MTTTRQNPQTVFLAWAVAVGMMGVMGALSQSAAAETPTVKEILSTIEKGLGNIECLETRVTSSATILNHAVEDDQVLFVGGFFWNIDEYAWADEGRKQSRVRKYWRTATVEEYKSRTPSIWAQEWLIFDGQRHFRNITERQPSGETETTVASIQPASTDNPINFQFGNVYHECVGSFFGDDKDLDVWNVRAVDQVEEKVLYAFSLPAALEKRNYTVSPQMESVHGIDCWVLEADSQDRLWLAPEYGFAIVERQWRYGPNEPLKFRYVNGDFKEVVPGLWLPYRAERFCMARPKYEPKHVNTPHFVVRCDVTEIRVNDLPDDLFVMHFSPGAIIVDMAAVEGAVVTYTAGATPEATQRALDRAVGRRPGLDERLERRGNGWIILIGLHVVALVVFAAWVYCRRRQTSP